MQNESPAKSFITESEAVSLLDAKDFEDFIPHARLVHGNNKHTQELLRTKSTANNDKEAVQYLKPASSLYDYVKHKLDSKPNSISYNSLQYKLPTKRPLPLYDNFPSHDGHAKEPLEQQDGEPANQYRNECLNQNINEIPKASIKVGKSQQYNYMPSNKINNTQLAEDGDLTIKQFTSTVKVQHNTSNEIPKASIKVGKSQYSPSNKTIFKQSLHEKNLLPVKQSCSIVSVSHKPENEIAKASITVDGSRLQKYKCLPSNITVNKQLSDEGELSAQQSYAIINVTHNPTNETSIAFIKEDVKQKHQYNGLPSNSASCKELENEEVLTMKQSYSTVKIPYNTINQIPKASVKVGKTQCLSPNNAVHKQLPHKAKVSSVKQSYNNTVNVSPNAKNEISKVSIKKVKSQHKCLPSNTTIIKQLPQEGELLIAKQSNSTKNMSYNQVNQFRKASTKMGKNRQHKCKSLPSNNIAFEQIYHEGDILSIKQPYSTGRLRKSTSEIPKASMKVSNGQQQQSQSLSSDTTNKKIPFEGEQLAIKKSYNINLPNNTTNDIPKASIKVMSSKNSVNKKFSDEGDLSEQQFLYS